MTTECLNPQVSNVVKSDKGAQFVWREVPGVYEYEANADGAVRRSNGWTMSCMLHPVEGVLVPVRFEGGMYWVPRRFFVAAAHLEKPDRVLTDNRRGGLALRYIPAHRNGDVVDDRALNLYWRELPEPVDFEFLMREAKWATRPVGVSPATSAKWPGE